MQHPRVPQLHKPPARPHPFVDPAVHMDTRPVMQVRPRYFVGIVVLILLVGLVLRAWDLGAASYWTDEALTALRAHDPLRDTFQSLANSGNQAPLYFLSLRVLPTTTEALLRWPSVLLGILGIAGVIFVIAQLYENYDLALWVGALLAVNPFHVWLSRMARPYPLIFILSLGISYGFILLLRRHPRSPLIWRIFTLASMSAYITHYTTGSLAIAQAILLLFTLKTNRDLIGHWIQAQIIAVIPSLIWLIIQARQPMNVGGAWVPAPNLEDVPYTLWNMTLGYNGVFKWYFLPGIVVVTIGTLLGLRQIITGRVRNSETLYWLWLILVPFVPAFLVSQVISSSFYVDRYFTVCWLGLILLMIHGWTHYYTRWVWRAALAIIILTGAFNVLVSFNNGSYRRADWRPVIKYLAQEFQPGDVLLIGQWNEREVFQLYAEPAAPHLLSNIIVLENAPDPVTFDASTDRVWVLYRNPVENVHHMNLMPRFDPFDPTLSPLGAWLNQRQTRVLEQIEFNGITVLKLAP